MWSWRRKETKVSVRLRSWEGHTSLSCLVKESPLRSSQSCLCIWQKITSPGSWANKRIKKCMNGNNQSQGSWSPVRSALSTKTIVCSHRFRTRFSNKTSFSTRRHSGLRTYLQPRRVETISARPESRRKTWVPGRVDSDEKPFRLERFHNCRKWTRIWVKMPQSWCLVRWKMLTSTARSHRNWHKIPKTMLWKYDHKRC